MLQKKLPINLSSLWTPRTDKLIIRFHNIDEASQATFIKRIKETAPQRAIKVGDRISKQTIKEILNEINPIIFSEHRGNWYPENSYRNFNKSSIQTAGDHSFKVLCQIIYLAGTGKKIPHNLLRQIIRLTHGETNRIDTFLRAAIDTTQIPTEETPGQPIEISLETLASLRNRVNSIEHNIPESMYSPVDTPENEECTGIDYPNGFTRSNTVIPRIRQRIINSFTDSQRAFYDRMQEEQSAQRYLRMQAMPLDERDILPGESATLEIRRDGAELRSRSITVTTNANGQIIRQEENRPPLIIGDLGI